MAFIMEKELFVNVLLDAYRNLLTKRQADILSLYFEEDLSLAEISEHYNITRQGVLNVIKHGESKLRHFEECIGAVALYTKISRIAQIIIDTDDNNKKNELAKLIISEVDYSSAD